jgi:hypothetical protein
MTPRVLALARAEVHLIERLEKLEVRLDDDPARWLEYASLASALAAIAPQMRPEALAEVLSQKELGERLGVSAKTIRRRVLAGQLPPKRRYRPEAAR